MNTLDNRTSTIHSFIVSTLRPKQETDIYIYIERKNINLFYICMRRMFNPNFKACLLKSRSSVRELINNVMFKRNFPILKMIGLIYAF